MEDDKFSMLGNAEAIEKLLSGKLDAVFMVSGENSKDVQKLFAEKDFFERFTKQVQPLLQE